MEFNVTSEKIVESIFGKSRFISIVFPVSDTEYFKKRLSRAQLEYPKATHYCYGYRIGIEERAEDAGEPSRSAGYPILDLLVKKSLKDVAIIVIRYFHPPKLGLGPLTRAYRNAAKNVLDDADLLEVFSFFSVKLKVNHDDYGQLVHYLTRLGKNVNYIDVHNESDDLGVVLFVHCYQDKTIIDEIYRLFNIIEATTSLEEGNSV